MKKNPIIFVLFLLFLGTFMLQAQVGLTVTVSTNTELNTEIGNATAGKTIILANGTWTNVQLNFAKTGTAANPITIKAETPGSVFIEGNSYVKMGGQYIIFEGVIFQNPSGLSASTPVIDFRASSTDCNNCKVTNIKIDSFNAVGQDTEVFKWILLRGANNEVSYCSFLGKHGVGSIINDNRSSTSANYHKIHHNYFADRTPQGTSVVNDDNDQDAIRIGSSSTSLSNSFTEVYDNYFYNFVGEIEVISNKSGSNKYYNNTFEDYSGALTLRHGDNCEVYNNFFLANGHSFSGGVRVMGENHKIYNNYIEGTRAKYPNNSSTNGLAGINIHNGILNSPLNGYYQVKNATIVNNTFVNCDLGIRVGATFSAGTQNQPPQDVIIGNNLFFVNATIPDATNNRSIKVTTQLTGASSSYENNIRQTPSTTATSYIFDSFGAYDGGNNAIVEVPPTEPALLALGADFYNIVSGSAAIDHGAGSYIFLTEDIRGGTRPIGASIDAGAEEFGSGGTGKPYTQSDVGVTIGFGGTTLSNSDTTFESKKFLLYPNPVKGDYLNIYLKNQNLGNIEILDVLGRIISIHTIESNRGTIYVDKLTKGSYFLRVHGVTKKFIR